MNWNVKVLCYTGLLMGLFWGIGCHMLPAQVKLSQWQIGLRGSTEVASAYQIDGGEFAFSAEPRLTFGAGIFMRRWFLPHVGIEMGGSAVGRGYQAPYPLLNAYTESMDTLPGHRVEQWWQVPVGLCFRAGAWYAALGPFAEVYQDGHWRIQDQTGMERRIPLSPRDLAREVTFGAWFGTGFTLQLSQQLGILTSLRAHITDPVSLAGLGSSPGNSVYTGNVNGGVNLGLLYQL